MNNKSEITEHWLGLCPKAPVIRASLTVIDNSPLLAYEGPPDGGGGGPGTIRRGIEAALSGTKTLARNRQLLWFTLLAGLVLAGNTIGQSALYYIGWTAQPDMIVRLVLDFFIEFATLFCLVFLLAGLVLRISSKKEDPASFFVEIAEVRKYLKAIFLWSFVLALAGILLFRISDSLLFLSIFGPISSFLTNTLSQFPFNLTLIPSKVFTELPGDQGQLLLSWIYPFGFMDALIFSAINLLLFILTPFVVPFIVLEQKTLREAVAESFAMMKRIWIEVAACAVLLGVVIFGVLLTYLLVQAAHGIVTPSEVVIYPPTDTWIYALGLLYDLALLSIAFVVATIGGIASLNLYTNAKTGQIPGSADTKTPA
jgi:hypothetical protein